MADQAVNIQATEPEVAKPVDEVMAEEPKAEEPKAEEPKVEEKKTEEPKATENGEAKTEEHKTRAHHEPSQSKYDPSVMPVTDDPQQIRVQVEFYFGDSNLPQDEYLWKLTGGFENNPVPLKKITSFARMRRFQPYEAVVQALRDSHHLDVTGEDGEELIARKVAYKSSMKGDKMPVTVYAKGFGEEKASTQFDLEAFFRQYAPVSALRLRRTPELLFKGSVFVEFESEEAAKTFLAIDPQPKWEGQDLKIMSKKAYVDEKMKMIEEGKMQPSASRAPRTFWEGEQLGRSRGGRGGNSNNFKGDRDDWRARKDHDRRGGGRGGGRGGRGGRGRGRGGRGGGDRRDRDRDSRPKRSRDDDGAEAPPAKKVDTKAETSGEAAA